MKVAILTSPDQWFEDYALELSRALCGASILKDHNAISESYDVLFILSYHKVVDKETLARNRYNVVIHESDLPWGKGWAPLFWQVLEGKNEITFSMFEAGEGVDSGDVYMKRVLKLSGEELNREIREKQASLSINMCVDFIENMNSYLPPKRQNGIGSFYDKRKPADSKLDINKTIKDQFNLLRIVDNSHYPAFFEMNGRKYIIKIVAAD